MVNAFDLPPTSARSSTRSASTRRCPGRSHRRHGVEPPVALTLVASVVLCPGSAAPAALRRGLHGRCGRRRGRRAPAVRDLRARCVQGSGPVPGRDDDGARARGGTPRSGRSGGLPRRRWWAGCSALHLTEALVAGAIGSRPPPAAGDGAPGCGPCSRPQPWCCSGAAGCPTVLALKPRARPAGPAGSELWTTDRRAAAPFTLTEAKSRCGAHPRLRAGAFRGRGGRRFRRVATARGAFSSSRTPLSRCSVSRRT